MQSVAELAARFWSKVNKDGPVHATLGACWIWTGATYKTRSGAPTYGHMGGFVGASLAHRISWTLAHGQVETGLFVLHHCDNMPCVNPAHLFLGTQADNIADMKAKGRARGPAGEASPNAKLTVDTVAEARRMRTAGSTYQAIGEHLGVSAQSARAAVLRHTWASVP